MPKTKSPGRGYRWVKVTELLQEGDQHCACGKWLDTVSEGSRCLASETYRRRILKQPSNFRRDYFSVCISKEGFAYLRLDTECVVLEPEEAKPLAEWLTEYVEWGESKGITK